MKASNIKCKFKHYISTMVMRESYMHEFNVSKDTKQILAMMKGERRWQ